MKISTGKLSMKALNSASLSCSASLTVFSLGPLALGNLPGQELNTRHPSNHANRQKCKPSQETNDLFQKGLCLGIANNDIDVQALEIIRDIENASEQYKDQTSDNQLPAIGTGLEPIPPHGPKKDYCAQQDNGAKYLENYINHHSLDRR
jgi:hypothetical protein